MKAIKLMLMVLIGVILFSWARGTGLSSIRFPFIPLPIDTSNPAQEDKNQDPVSVDSALLVVLERYPMKAILALKGELPTPCHELVWEVSGPNNRSIIEVTTFAESDSNTFCIQILEPFEVQIPLGDFTVLGFSVRLNGDVIGDL
jgi:hypothetical protein